MLLRTSKIVNRMPIDKYYQLKFIKLTYGIAYMEKSKRKYIRNLQQKRACISGYITFLYKRNRDI